MGFDDENVGPEAKKVYEEAQAMIADVIKNKRFQAHAVYGIFPANTNENDDIEVFAADDTDRTESVGTFYTLRQQAETESDEPFMSLGDFIAPKSSGIKDYIGAFAVSAGFGMDEYCKEFEDANDDYSSIMAKALADRFAEAMAEYLHCKVRKEDWGYRPEETMNAEDMLKVKYQGIRPAPGYPSQPDHNEKPLMWKLMAAQDATGIQLTESLAMLPAASVSGLMFAHPDAKYFSVGSIKEDQIKSYAGRKGVAVEKAETWLGANLAYDNNAPAK